VNGRELREWLHRSAKRDVQRRFHQLYDKVWNVWTFQVAWQQVRANKGAPGPDGVTIEEIEARGVDAFLMELSQELRERRYRTGPIRRRYIPKAALKRDTCQEGRELKSAVRRGHYDDLTLTDFCHRVGLNYVSCSPFRVPIARLAAAHAALKDLAKKAAAKKAAAKKAAKKAAKMRAAKKVTKKAAPKAKKAKKAAKKGKR
jgi:hypothetical protein